MQFIKVKFKYFKRFLITGKRYRVTMHTVLNAIFFYVELCCKKNSDTLKKKT